MTDPRNPDLKNYDVGEGPHKPVFGKLLAADVAILQARAANAAWQQRSRSLQASINNTIGRAATPAAAVAAEPETPDEASGMTQEEAWAILKKVGLDKFTPEEIEMLRPHNA